MDSLSLKCPLCCDETFSSHDSLKYHLLSLIENLICPACDKTFYNLYHLTDHLGRECRDQDTDNLPKDNYTDQENVQENIELVVPKVEMFETEENYFCHMCNFNISSIEEHLSSCHQGEEIIMESDSKNDANQGIDSVVNESEDDGAFFNEDVEEDEGDYDSNTVQEEQCLDKEGRAYIRRVIKINKFWVDSNENLPPITEKYAIDHNGKARKLEGGVVNDNESRATIFTVHQCPNCYLQFPQMEHYKKHICNLSRPKNKFKCIHCSAMYDSFESLNQHMQNHLKVQTSGEVKRIITIEPFKCDVCNTIFPSYRSLRLHQRMHDPVKDQAVDPPVSYTVTDSGDNKKNDLMMVRRMFVCNICNNTYDKVYEEVHMKSHSGVENYDCSICNRKFHTKENLEMHSRAHKQINKYSCTYCKKTFTTYESLEEHVANQCQQRQYECQYCGRRFARPHEKVKHERIHTGEKPHVCQICGKSFRVSYCLTLHLRTHSGTRPYKCEHCGKRFKSHSVYNHHMLTHSSIRGYKCPFCPKAFKTSVQLAGHKNSHTKPFTCNKCNRPFASLYAVRAHMESHKRDNNLKYDCLECGATYARAYALRDHMKTHNEGGGEEVENHDAVDFINDSEFTETETVQSTVKIETQMVLEDTHQQLQDQQML